MSVASPIVYMFPRDRETEAEPLQVDPESEAPGDHSLFPAMSMFASSISALLMNLGGIEGGDIPELTLVNTERIQIFFDGEHLIEADTRRAGVGTYYLNPIGEITLHKVTDVTPQSPAEADFEISERSQELIDGPADELTLKHCYTLTQDKEGPYAGPTEHLPREMFERDGSLGGYVDPPPIPFIEISEAISEVTSPAKNHQLSEFD